MEPFLKLHRDCLATYAKKSSQKLDVAWRLSFRWMAPLKKFIEGQSSYVRPGFLPVEEKARENLLKNCPTLRSLH